MPSLARAAARPRIAGEMDGHAEVGDAAHAAYERTRPDPVDAIVMTLLQRSARVAAALSLPNGPITQLSPYFT